MDGNGRWAHRRGLPVAAGHRAGTAALRRTVEAAPELGVRSLCVYAFSTENWARPDEEVADLMDLFAETIRDQFEDLHRQGVRIRFVGRRDRASDALLAQMAGIEDAHGAPTSGSTSGWRSTTAGGPRSSRPAARSCARASPPDEIDADVLRAHLAAPDLPDPDLVIRTVGRAPHLELPALAVGLRRVHLHAGALARLRAATPSARPWREYAGRRRRFGRR